MFEKVFIRARVPYKEGRRVPSYERRDLLAYLRPIALSKDDALLPRILSVPRAGVSVWAETVTEVMDTLASKHVAAKIIAMLYADESTDGAMFAV